MVVTKDLDIMQHWMFMGLALLSSTASYGAETRIIGGGSATEGVWPWIVSLEYASSSGTPYDAHFCGGSLIAADWVLTAAHCVEGESAAHLLVRVGGYDLGSVSTAGRAAAVDRILVHPEYNTLTYDQDLALLHLSSKLNLESLAPIGYSAMASLSAGTSLTVMGWGATQETSPYNYPKVLQQVDIPLLSDTDCSSAYGSEVTGNMLCAGELAGGKDSCYGDSGGPLISGNTSSNAQQVGIVSWGNGCGLAHYPGVYTRLANYTDWLTQHQAHLSMDTHTDLGYAPVGYAISGAIPAINNGQSQASLGALVLDSGNGFTLAANSCTDVAAGAGCAVTVSFSQASAGSHTEMLSATDLSSTSVLENKLTAVALPVVSFSNAPARVWYSGGDSVWQDGTMTSNRLPLVAGNNFKNSLSVLQTTITGPATVSFDWSVANGSSQSVLSYRLDGGVQGSTSSSSWQTQTLAIPAGTHLLEWRFTKSDNALYSAEAQLANLAVTATPGDGSGDTTSSSSSGGGSIGWLWSLVLIGLGWQRRYRARVG
jgi:secreted trypsin-like serine protease